jgi:hypothetical protein
MAESKPWALHGMAERLLEPVSRGMWADPQPAPSTGYARCSCKPRVTWKAESSKPLRSPSPGLQGDFVDVCEAFWRKPAGDNVDTCLQRLDV